MDRAPTGKAMPALTLPAAIEAGVEVARLSLTHCHLHPHTIFFLSQETPPVRVNMFMQARSAWGWG